MTVTLSLYRYDGLAARLWAFGQMGFARLPLRRITGLRDWKLMGTGAGEGFSARPNFGVYALLCIWDSPEHAAVALTRAEPFGRFCRHAAQRVDLTLLPTQAR
ncbi:MAG: spheroidene monooxygenase, partial [Phyllobacteriaceae bacterium]|nr:spheroidene monooxygenase [Phyllobacteriaceae bacterium]